MRPNRNGSRTNAGGRASADRGRLVARRSAVLGGILTVAVVAGVAPAHARAGPGTRSFAVSNRSSGCSEGYAGQLVPFEQADKLLPKGWVARDAGDQFGSPAPFGMGAVFLGSDACKRSALGHRAEAELQIYVDTPKIAGYRAMPGESDYYIAYYRSMTPGLLNVMKDAHVAAAPAQVETSVAVLPGGGGTATGSAQDRSGRGFTYDLPSPIPPTSTTGTAVWWFQTPTGVLAMTFYVTGDIWMMGGGTCSVTDPALARSTGYTSCPPGTISFAETGGSWTGKISFFPGAHPS
jgi:hypothetical protein